MTDVFISYSRKDIAFARLLHQSLKENGLETWIDWQDIPPSADWLAEVYEAIEGADAFVFVISETSLNSEICGLEINHAAKHNKRLIPIVIKDVDAGQVPKELSVLNWIFFKEAGEKFAEAMEDLITAITVDQDWIKSHTRFENRALAWYRKENDRGLLLRGIDLTEAESWLAGAAGKDPQPTALQTQFILKSRQDSTRRQRLTLIGVGIGLLVAVVLGVVAWGQRNQYLGETHVRATAQNEAIAEANMRATAQSEAETAKVEAEQQRDIALSRFLVDKVITQLDENNWDLALLLAVEAGKLADTHEAISALRDVIAAPVHTLLIMKGHQNSIQSLNWSPDKSMIASTGGRDLTLRIWDGTSGELLHLIETPYVHTIRWSPEGSRVLGVGGAGFGVWDSKTGTQLFWISEENERDITFADWVNNGSDVLGYFGSLDDNAGFSLARYAVYDGYTGEKGLVSSGELYKNGWGEIISHDKTRIILWQRDRPYFSGQVMDWETGEVILSLPETNGGVEVIWSADDSKIYLHDFADLIQVWEVDSGKLLLEIPLEVYVDNLILDATGNHILLAQCDLQSHTSSACVEGSGHIWDVEAGVKAVALTGFKNDIIAATFSPDGDRVATISYDPALDSSIAQVWDANTGTELVRFHGVGSKNLQWSDDGTRILTESGIIWDATTGMPISNLSFSSRLISWDETSDQILMAVGFDARVLSTQPAGEGPIIYAHPEGVSSVIWHPSGDVFLTSGCEAVDYRDVCVQGDLKTWDAGTGELLKIFEGHKGNASANWNQAGDRIASVSTDDTLRIWDVNNGAEILQITPPAECGWITGFSWSQDESKILTYSTDLFHKQNNSCIWDATSGELLLALSIRENTQDVLRSAFWSPDGSRVLTFTYDMSLYGAGSRAQVWDALTGEEQLRLVSGEGSQAVGGKAIWNPGGDSIFVDHTSSKVFGVWDARTGDEKWSFNDPNSFVTSPAWSPTGDRIAIGIDTDHYGTSGGNVIRIFDGVNGKVFQNLLGHTEAIRQLIWNQDGTRILSRSDDNTIRIWDCGTGIQLNQLIQNQRDLTYINWSPDERNILTASKDGTVRTWFTWMEDLLEAACQIAPRNMSEHEWSIYFRETPYRETCLGKP